MWVRGCRASLSRSIRELPDPAYAAIVVQTLNDEARDFLKLKVRKMVAEGRFPEALVRVTQFVFGPPVHYSVLFRVVGPDLAEIRKIANQVRGRHGRESQS